MGGNEGTGSKAGSVKAACKDSLYQDTQTRLVEEKRDLQKLIEDNKLSLHSRVPTQGPYGVVGSGVP